MIKYLKHVFALFILSSCVTARHRMLENSGAIRADFSKDPEYDYIVKIEGVVFMFWDGNVKQDRQNALISMFGDRCGQLKVSDEVCVEGESEQSGRPISTWILKVKCINR